MRPVGITLQSDGPFTKFTTMFKDIITNEPGNREKLKAQNCNKLLRCRNKLYTKASFCFCHKKAFVHFCCWKHKILKTRSALGRSYTSDSGRTTRSRTIRWSRLIQSGIGIMRSDLIRKCYYSCLPSDKLENVIRIRCENFPDVSPPVQNPTISTPFQIR